MHGDTASTAKAQVTGGPNSIGVQLALDANSTWLYISDVGCGLSRVRLAAPYTIEVLANSSVITSLAGGLSYIGTPLALNEAGTAVYLGLETGSSSYRILKHSLTTGNTTVAVGSKTSGFNSTDYEDGLMGTAATARPQVMATGAAGYEVFWLDMGPGDTYNVIRGLEADGTVSGALLQRGGCV